MTERVKDGGWLRKEIAAAKREQKSWSPEKRRLVRQEISQRCRAREKGNDPQGHQPMTPRKSIQLDIPETAAERIALEDSKKLPKCWGVSRVADNEKAILVSFERPLSNHELRVLDDLLKGRG